MNVKVQKWLILMGFDYKDDVIILQAIF